MRVAARRGIVGLIAGLLVVVPLVPVRAVEERALEGSARASILFANIDVQPVLDPALVDSRVSTSTLGNTSLQSVVWPAFLVDAFFFLYGFQSVERVGLGIAEARWPQGPTEADATRSDLLFLNGGDPDAVPGQLGRSHAAARADGADGEASLGASTLPGGLVIGAATSHTSVDAETDVVATAEQTVTDVVAGPLSIESIHGTAEATVRTSGASKHRLVIAGATVAGVPVVLDDEGARAASAPAQAIVDAALAGSGIGVRVLPASSSDDDGSAQASSGGVLIEVAADATDPTGDAHSVRLGYLLGAASASARAVALPTFTPPERGTVTHTPPIIDTYTIPAPPAPPVGDLGTTVRRRTIITTATAGVPIGARGIYAAVVLAALGMVLIRPLIRSASRT